MTTETILTDDVIHNLIVDLGIECDYGIETTPVDNIIPFARAIEKAVLQSLPVQTSSTIRGDSYAGVYVWWGKGNITQHIPKSLVKSESNSYGLLKCVASECIRDLEQAMLKSAEVQELRKNAERMQFVADEDCVFDTCIQTDGTTKYRLGWDAGTKWQVNWFDSPSAAIDAAMENKNEDS